MDYSTPIKKLLWTGKISDFADVRLFYYHLMIDLHLWTLKNDSVRELKTDDDKPVFTDRAALAYDMLLDECSEFSGPAKYILEGIWPELKKWESAKNNDPIKRMSVISDSSGKVLYEAEFMSDFPTMSVLHTVIDSSGNKLNNKVGFGTIKYMVHPDEAESFYKFYDNELKENFHGVLYKLKDGSFEVRGDFNSAWEPNLSGDS